MKERRAKIVLSSSDFCINSVICLWKHNALKYVLSDEVINTRRRV